jgi:hypothetical protein
MKLVVLSGRPAVGKVTVARELARLTGWRLFHNHLTVNLALALFEFGTPGFVALRETVWFAAFRRALADRVPAVIFTFNPESTVPQRFIDELFAEIAAGGGSVVHVELVAPEAEIERRIAADSRHADGKLTDLALYRRLRDAGTFDTPVLPPARLRLDTSSLVPAAAAAHIAASCR